MKIITIVAISKNGVIGKNNTIPWNCPEDLKLFKELTSNHIVIMGRKTFESIGKPLNNRINIIISSKKQLNSNNVFYFDNIYQAKYFAKNIARKYNKNIFIIGGSKIYQFFIPFSNYIYLSLIKEIFSGNIFFPKFSLKDYNVVSINNYNDFKFFKLHKIINNNNSN